MPAIQTFFRTSLLLLVGWCFGFASTTHASAKEEIAFIKEGITVWKVPVENSEMIGFKAQATIDAPVASVFATIIDVDHASEWLPNIGQISIIEQGKAGLGASKLYFVIDMPFPLSDRHLVVNSVVKRTEDNGVIIENTADNTIKFTEDTGRIRITDYRGGWLLEPVGEQTKVTLNGFADPAGGIPAWVANMFVTQQPFDMLKNMKKQAKKARYKNAKLNF